MYFFLLFTYHIAIKVIFISMIWTKPSTAANKNKMLQTLNEWFISLLDISVVFIIEVVRVLYRKQVNG